MDYRYQTNPYQMYTPYSGQMQPSPMMQSQQSTTLQNQPMQVSNPSSGFTCRPVTSREEALAVQVDYFSPGTIMPDLAHGMIYLKRFNSQTGASDLLDFRISDSQQDAKPYDPKSEIESLKKEVSSLREELEEAKKSVQKKPAGKAVSE